MPGPEDQNLNTSTP